MLLVGLVLSLAPGLASAQSDQTVDGAQKFIAVIASQHATRLETDWGNGFGTTLGRHPVQYCQDIPGFFEVRRECGYNYPAELVTRPQPSLDAASKISDCSTRFQYTDSATAIGEYTITPTGTTTVDVDWSKVASVATNGVYVFIEGQRPRVRLEMASVDLAARIAFAMEFLRTNCDEAASTGF